MKTVWRLLRILLALLVIAIVAMALYVRLAPTDPAAWDINPQTAQKPASNNSFLVREGTGDLQGRVYPLAPEALLSAFNEVASNAPRTQVIAGSVVQGRITYLTRSLVWGFPDFTTVTAVPTDGGSRLVIFARARFGEYDFEANRTRTERWLLQMRANLPSTE